MPYGENPESIASESSPQLIRVTGEYSLEGIYLLKTDSCVNVAS